MSHDVVRVHVAGHYRMSTSGYPRAEIRRNGAVLGYQESKDGGASWFMATNEMEVGDVVEFSGPWTMNFVALEGFGYEVLKSPYDVDGA